MRLQQRITDVGGKADNGLPLFRVMRGCDRMTWIGGKWEHFDNSGNITGSHIGVEHVHKHPEAKDRYIFEMLMMPEYTREEWRAIFTQNIEGQFIESLGPYPENGEYELFKVIEKVFVDQKTGKILRTEFVPLTESLCDALVVTAKLNKDLPAKHKILAARERREREEKAIEQRQSDIIRDLEGPNWQRQPHILSPGLSKEQRSSGGIILS